MWRSSGARPARGLSAARSSGRPLSPRRQEPALTPSGRPSPPRRSASAEQGLRCRRAKAHASRRSGCRPRRARPRRRTETGTSARISTPSVRIPREIRNERSAPATTASTTSLTVPPKAFLTSLKSWSELATPTKRLCGPMSTFSGVSGAGFRPAHTISPIPSAASRARANAWSGCDRASSAPSASSIAARTAPRKPAATSSAAPGSL